jgi:hypothetical protein
VDEVTPAPCRGRCVTDEEVQAQLEREERRREAAP